MDRTFRNRMSALALAAALAVPFASARANPTADPAAASEVPEIDMLYALGLAMARSVSGLELTADEVAAVQQGIADGALAREARVDLEVVGPRMDAYLRERIVERTKARGAAYRETAKAEPGAVVTESGMIFFERAAGDGPTPGAADTVRIHYRGTRPDGSEFDSSEGGEPAEFNLGEVIACFREGISRMKVGGKARLVCPPEIAYGERGYPQQILPGETLVFDVELLGVVSAGDATGEAPAGGAEGGSAN